MKKAYMLLNATRMGYLALDAVRNKIRQITGVTGADTVGGEYDIVVTIEGLDTNATSRVALTVAATLGVAQSTTLFVDD